jgi:hypothetical protein
MLPASDGGSFAAGAHSPLAAAARFGGMVHEASGEGGAVCRGWAKHQPNPVLTTVWAAICAARG